MTVPVTRTGTWQTAADATGVRGTPGNVTAYGWGARSNPTAAKLPAGAASSLAGCKTVAGADLPGRLDTADGVKATGIREKELSMAEQLIGDMTERLDLRKYRDTFRDDILALVKRKIKAGKTERVETPEAAPQESAPSNVIDLTELLKRSLHGGRANAGRSPAANRRKRAPPAKARSVPAEKRRRAS